MSQQQNFGPGGIPFAPNIQFIAGSNNVPVPPDPLTFTIDLSSGLVSNDVSINEHPSTFDLDFVDIVKYTKYVVDKTSFISVINFSGNFVAANSIVATVDSVALPAVPFNTDNATTIQDLATQIEGAADVIVATVTGTNQITVQFTNGAHTVNSVITSGGASQPTATINESTNAPYYTIQSAINAASNDGGGVVAVRWNPSAYIENLTLLPNVDLVAVSPDPKNTSPIGCVIQGNHSLGQAGVLHINGFYLTSIALDTITINNAAGIGRIYLNNCVIDNSVRDAFVLSSAVGGAQAFLHNVDVVAGKHIGNLGTSGYMQICGGFLYGGAGSPGFTVGVGGVVIAKDTQLSGNTSTFDLTDVTSTISLTNVICVAGTAIVNFTAAGSASCYGCVFDTSSGAGNIVTGAGTFSYSDITSIGSAINIDVATTQVVNDWKPHSTAGTSVTGIKGTSSFDSNDFTVTDGFVQIKGSQVGTGQTIGAVTANLITVPLGVVAGVYQFEASVKGFESSTPAGAGYDIFGTFITDGITATLVGDQAIFNESPALAPADAYFIASGNSAVLQVLGVALLTIDWSSELVET